MRITVTASRRDDILRRKAEYEEQFNAQKARHDEQYGQYRDAVHKVFAEVEEAVRAELGDSVGELEIRVDTRYGHGLQVEIGNDRGGPRRGPGSALTWRWSATLMKDGSVSKESGSWSGLEATTPEQLEDLKLTVRQLEIINSMDWANLLNKTLPNWEDYVTEREPSRRDMPNFDQELLEADLEDAIGASVLIKAHSGRDYRGDVYFQILRDSGSQYTVKEAPAMYVDKLRAGDSLPYSSTEIKTVQDLMERWASSVRIRKANFMNMIYQPIQKVEF